jgi:hypothetical protein
MSQIPGESDKWTSPAPELHFSCKVVNQDPGELNEIESLSMSTVPEGWTDDMTIVVPNGRSLDDIVDCVLQAKIRQETPSNTVHHLIAEFGLTQSDAELALDRTYGGVVRAATGRLDNSPQKEKDPMAWTSFQRCLKQPELVAAIYPQFARRSQIS